MKYPEYVEINNKKYKINTDFRVAIECQDIALNNNIDDCERALAIIYKLYGEEGLNAEEDYEMLLELAKKYLSCNKEVNTKDNKQPDMDFVEDMDYIEASFMSDYNIDLTDKRMHWWKFYNLLNGLSNSEFGNCCVLNRIRNLRNFDVSKIEDSKQAQEIKKAQKQVELKRYKLENNLTKEQLESLERLNKIIGL